jgi:hypothetical protein
MKMLARDSTAPLCSECAMRGRKVKEQSSIRQRMEFLRRRLTICPREELPKEVEEAYAVKKVNVPRPERVKADEEVAGWDED